MRLERSRTNSRLFGLCGGIARSMDIDAAWVRLAFVIGIFLTGGVLLFVYILASMVIPRESASSLGAYWYVPAAPAYGFNSYGASASAAAPAASLDSMMQKLEEQALTREISELRAKLARYEQQ